ncbi:UxaA family hydrolase [Pedobacter nutrimenti]|uniref:UxaA family hydrolase n=1 Tax=Pedobacter nutrimenti TaxID=1241337 RepID=UPI002931ECE8|nr:UxaA family hydrolase [Pedobacter nutrimenti]
MQKFIKLHPLDNVQIVVSDIKAGDVLLFKGNKVYFEKSIGIGHKIAEQFIVNGQKIIKCGVPIGSATADIVAGEHVHLHNMKSDYIPTYTIQQGFKED